MKTRNFKSKLMLVIALVSVSFITSVLGQVPEKMSYQAVVRNATNQLVVNKQIGVLISITQGIFPPVTVYSESHIATTNSNGLLTLQLGGGKLVSGNFSTIKWENGNVSVSANYDLSGGTNYSLLSSSQLLSVPYALYAKTAGNATGGTTCPDGTTVGEIKYWNGTSWITVAPSLNGMVLTLEGGVPVWKENKNTTVTFSVNTLSISNVTINSVKCEGFVTGGSVQTERGVLYGTSPNLTISSHDRLLFGKGTGNFTMDIIDLIPNTKYYVRTYATNPLPNTTETTTVYGEELSFTTLTPPATGLPTLITLPADNPVPSHVSTGGNIYSAGGSPIIARGVCWSYSPNPTVSVDATSEETSIGIFPFDIAVTGRIYIRAWARNSYGIAYGNEVSIIAE